MFSESSGEIAADSLLFAALEHKFSLRPLAKLMLSSAYAELICNTSAGRCSKCAHRFIFQPPLVPQQTSFQANFLLQAVLEIII